MQPVTLVDRQKKNEKRPRKPSGGPGETARLKITDIAFFGRFMKPLLNLYLICLGLTIVITLFSSALPLAGKFFVDFVVMKKGADQAGKLLGPLYPAILIVSPGFSDKVISPAIFSASRALRSPMSFCICAIK